MRSNLFSKILGVGVAATIVIALGGALLSAAPVAADLAEWSKVNTPSWEDGVILPASDILDYDISGDDGSTIYVVAVVDRTCAEKNPFLADIYVDLDEDGEFDEGDLPFDYGLFKSSDGGVTWKDITQNVIDTENLPNFFDDDDEVNAMDILSLNYVAVAPDDPDWVAVTGYIRGFNPNDNAPFTVASKDGGDGFTYAGDMEDDEHGTSMDIVYDTEVSPEIDDVHVIAAMGFNIADSAVGGLSDSPGVLPFTFELIDHTGSVFRLDAGTWLTGNWEDTSFYDGWDGCEEGNNAPICADSIDSLAIIDGEFSPNYEEDCALVVIGVADNPSALPIFPLYPPYVQTGDMCASQWGEEASLPDPIEITSDGDPLMTYPINLFEGITLPADYNATDPSTRTVFGYVDFINVITLPTTFDIGNFVFRIDGSEVSPQVSPAEDTWLASIAVSGTADKGKMMIGELINIEDPNSETNPCAGVRVWHTEELDICCPKWELCCKCPSGIIAARVAYTPDGAKEYATTSTSLLNQETTGATAGLPIDAVVQQQPGFLPAGDETAFSVSLDDATSWNQIGLIDTNINNLSDLAICPDCSVIYLSTINSGNLSACSYDWVYSCDSVWRSFDDGKTWERIFHGDWSDSPNQQLLLRLPCESVENCCNYSDPSAPGGTIYLGIQDDDDIFYSRDCGQCWTKTQDTKIDIQDFAVDTESTVYVLDDEGNVSKSTNFGRRWADSADTKAGSGHTITVCCGEGFVVVGPENGDDKVAWSDDGGDTWNQTDDLPGTGSYGVHVACATTCENIIYAAIGGEGNGIYRTDITDGSWDDLNANQYGYYGIAVGKSDGTLYAATNRVYTDEDADLCDRVLPPGSIGIDTAHSGVARNLDPCETACCGTEDWDYLICGMGSIISTEYFSNEPSALRICGCLTSATNTRLWAIDADLGYGYAVYDGTTTGTLWTYEDCASKVGPTLLAPADGTVMDCACEDCISQPFTLKWDRMCNSCSYDIEIMDEDGNVINSLVDIELTGTGSCSFVFNPQNSAFSNFFSELVCGSTYQWHVREANTTCECIHSRWSATWTFTIATSSANGVKLIAPKMAATDTGTANIGFSWSSVPDATSYSFVLSPNANLSGALVSQEIGTTAFNYAGPLENGKTYYWQVKAWKGTTLLSTSPIGVFTVGPKPLAPQPPVVVEQAPTPVINIPAAQQITPTWIYAIIGVGAALAVVVIVLIVKSRRS